MPDCQSCPISMRNEELRLRVDALLLSNNEFEQRYRSAKAEAVRLSSIALHERSIGAELWVSAILAIKAEVRDVAMSDDTPPALRQRLMRIAERVHE